jgi:predicted RNase H-like HicB family nuclease
MNEALRYVKIVEWSDEDHCFIGSCPSLFYGGCHGDDEQQVFAELCAIVQDTIELYKQSNHALPPSSSGKDYANKMLAVA